MIQLALLATLMLLGSPLFAAEPSPAELAVARELFESAEQAQQEEDWSTCERQIAEAVAIIETPGLRFHLAFCKERQGRWVAALVDYKRAQELVDGGVQASDVRQLLGPAIKRMKANTPRLRLTLAKIPPETTLYLDGKERSPRLLGKSVPVDPGGVRVSVSAPGFEPFERHVSLLSRERRNVGIVLVPKPPPSSESPARESISQNATPVPSSGSGVKGTVLIAEGALTLGSLALGVFSALEVSNLGRQRRSLLEGVGPGDCLAGANNAAQCDELDALSEDLSRAETLRLTGYVAASVGLTAFVTTWLLWETDSNSGAQGRIQVMPTIGGARATYVGSF